MAFHEKLRQQAENLVSGSGGGGGGGGSSGSPGGGLGAGANRFNLGRGGGGGGSGGGGGGGGGFAGSVEDALGGVEDVASDPAGAVSDATGFSDFQQSDTYRDLRSQRDEALDKGGVEGGVQALKAGGKAAADLALDNPNASLQETVQGGLVASGQAGQDLRAAVTGEEAGTVTDESVAKGWQDAFNATDRAVDDAVSGTPLDNQATDAAAWVGQEVIVDPLVKTPFKATTGIDPDSGSTEATIGPAEQFDALLVGGAGAGAKTVGKSSTLANRIPGLGDEAGQGADDAFNALTRGGDEAAQAGDEAGQAVDRGEGILTDGGRVIDDGGGRLREALPVPARSADEGARVVDDAPRGQQAVDEAVQGVDDSLSGADDVGRRGALRSFIRGGDDAATGADDLVRAGDDTARVGDDAARAADDTARVGDDAARAGDDAATAADDAAQAADESGGLISRIPGGKWTVGGTTGFLAGGAAVSMFDASSGGGGPGGGDGDGSGSGDGDGSGSGDGDGSGSGDGDGSGDSGGAGSGQWGELQRKEWLPGDDTGRWALAYQQHKSEQNRRRWFVFRAPKKKQLQAITSTGEVQTESVEPGVLEKLPSYESEKSARQAHGKWAEKNGVDGGSTGEEDGQPGESESWGEWQKIEQAGPWWIWTRQHKQEDRNQYLAASTDANDESIYLQPDGSTAGEAHIFEDPQALSDALQKYAEKAENGEIDRKPTGKSPSQKQIAKDAADAGANQEQTQGPGGPAGELVEAVGGPRNAAILAAGTAGGAWYLDKEGYVDIPVLGDESGGGS
jgi:hypothetical protein